QARAQGRFRMLQAPLTHPRQDLLAQRLPILVVRLTAHGFLLRCATTLRRMLRDMSAICKSEKQTSDGHPPSLPNLTFFSLPWPSLLNLTFFAAGLLFVLA